MKIKDVNFYHNKTGSTSPHHKSTIKWDRSLNDTSTVVYTDMCMPLALKDSHVDCKVAWILEPRSIFPTVYQWITDNYRYFNKVATYDKTLLESLPNARYCPFGTSWIPDEHWGQHEKTKLVSNIVSSKNVTVGHRLRQKLCPIQGVDHFGAYVQKPIESKHEALNDYMFSYAIENQKYDDYFTEKLIDCFATWTVPIYWGSPSIQNTFDTRGMIIVNTLKESQDAMQDLSKSKYESMLPYIEHNFEVAQSYKTAEHSLEKILCDI